MKNNPYMIVFDIDGTLAPYGKPISRYISDALCKLEEAGHQLCFASGKSCSYLSGFARGIGLFAPYTIGENGAVLQTGPSCRPVITSKRPAYFNDLQTQIAALFPDAFFQEDLINMTIFAEHSDTLGTIGRYLMAQGYSGKKDITIYTHEDAVQLIPNDVSKGNAIKKLKVLFGWKTENIIAAGDGDNDLSMRDEADTFFVIGNGLSSLKNNRFETIELFIKHLVQEIL